MSSSTRRSTSAVPGGVALEPVLVGLEPVLLGLELLGLLIHNNVMAKAKGKIKHKSATNKKVPKSHVKKTNTTKAMKKESKKSAPVTSTVIRRNAGVERLRGLRLR